MICRYFSAKGNKVMKRALAWVLVFLLIVVGAVVGTLAYLTDRDAKTNVFTIGDINIELLEYERTDVENKNEAATVKEFEDNKPLIPGVIQSDFDYTADGSAYVDWTAEGKADYQSPIWDPADINNELDKMVFIKNTGTNSAYVRTFLAFEAGAYTSFEQFSEKVHLNLNDKDWTWKWEPYIAKIGNEKYFIATATYNYVLEPGTLTEISLAQIALDPSATNLDVNAFGKTYNVPIIAQGIQTASFSDPFTALKTGFGDDIPFEGITFDKGVTASTALHYFEGNVAGTKITDKVTSVTYGTKSDYPEISGAYSGTLTLNDPGAPAHTYYVPSKTTEGNYDLYVLADEGKVYAPESCQDLFNGMSALTMVDAANLDVSQTTNMQSMFRNCPKLQTVDTSTWDVRGVTNMDEMFRFCNSLAEIDVSGWRLGKVTSTYLMFGECQALTTLDVSKWGMSSATRIQSMFESCASLKTLDVSKWVTSSLKNAQYTFRGCGALESIDVSGWDVDDVTNMLGMFWGCSKLTEIDVSKWNVDNATNMSSVFNGCSGLASLDVSGWNVANVTNFSNLFSGCSSLTELAVGGWDVSGAINMGGMFDKCSGLTSLDLSAWGNKLNGVTNMSGMFIGCSALTTLNVSAWDVSTVTNMTQMFFGCSSLTSLNVSDWDVGKVTSMNGMFRDCTALTSLNISDWDVSSVTSMKEMFLRCSGLTELDLSGWNTESLVNTVSMFHTCSNLKTIYVSENWNMGKLTSSDYMFVNCSNLVGGGSNKLTFNSQKVNADYANYTDGYLTYKEHTPATP